MLTQKNHFCQQTQKFMMIIANFISKVAVNTRYRLGGIISLVVKGFNYSAILFLYESKLQLWSAHLKDHFFITMKKIKIAYMEKAIE